MLEMEKVDVEKTIFQNEPLPIERRDWVQGLVLMIASVGRECYGRVKGGIYLPQ